MRFTALPLAQNAHQFSVNSPGDLVAATHGDAGLAVYHLDSGRLAHSLYSRFAGPIQFNPHAIRQDIIAAGSEECLQVSCPDRFLSGH